MAQPVKRRVVEIQFRQGFSLCECQGRILNQKATKLDFLGMPGPYRPGTDQGGGLDRG